MTDEIALNKAATKGVRAQQLIEDEILHEAFNGLEQAYIDGWRKTTIDDVTGREKLFLAINIVGKVREHLAKVAAEGRLAEAELRKIAQTAERKPRWEEVR